MVAPDASHGDRSNLQKLGWEAFGLSQKDGLGSLRAEPTRLSYFGHSPLRKEVAHTKCEKRAEILVISVTGQISLVRRCPPQACRIPHIRQAFPPPYHFSNL